MLPVISEDVATTAFNEIFELDEDILKEFLPVIDNFERGIKLDDNDLSDEVSKFLSGFKMIFGNLNNILGKHLFKIPYLA